MVCFEVKRRPENGYVFMNKVVECCVGGIIKKRLWIVSFYMRREYIVYEIVKMW